MNNVLATLPSASTQSQIGRMFSNVLDTRLLSGDSSSIVIANPIGSGRIMYLDSVFGGCRLDPVNQALSYESTTEVRIASDPTPSAGSFASNLNFGFPDNSAMIVAHIFESIGGFIVAGTTQVIGHFSLDFAGKIIIPPDHSLGVEVTVPGILSEGNAVQVRITVTWYELDEPTA
ncbi:hypothetical protein [Sporomusa sp.]|uniref:hypothetical protein n=1 Tax=Sporomusa sp. TaxID=2078658 RepID=UPI002CF0EBB8|nr:hypothetical protein [Sporomusa sp.]HWR43391.1 hypothetical protein [Sporomusa sp.]